MPALYRLALALALTAAAAAAQSASPALTVDAHNGYRVALRLAGLLADPELQKVVGSGLPLRVRVRVELWRDRLVDEHKGSEAWNAVLVYDPLEKNYRLRTQGSPSIDRRMSGYEPARAALEAPRSFALRPFAGGRYYFTANIEIETLSLSDLEELERWLKGELRPAVSGDRSLPNAIGEGAKRLLIRVLDLPTRTLELKTARFQVRNP